MNTTQAAIPGRSEAPRRLTALERRQAWARHRREAIRLVTAQVDWVPVLVFASILMSPEARIDLAGFQLYPYRLALIVSIPFIALRLAREPIRFGFADALVFGSASLMFVSTALHYPLDQALKSGGALTLDLVLAFILGRSFFRTSLDVRRFLLRVTPMLVAVALIMLAESVSHRYLFRPIVGAITGHSPADALERFYEIRLGFLRATGPFLHPIAAGLFFGSLAPLFIAADLPKWRWVGLLACFGGVFGWSSAGIVAIAAGIGLCGYESLQKRLRLGWPPLLGTILVVAVLIQVLSEGGFIKFVIRYAALNPQTGYFRLLIWDYGWANVLKSPWIGIGIFNSYERPAWMLSDSVDNYWLLQSLRYGIPSMLMILFGMLAIILRLAMSKQGGEYGSLTGRRMATGMVISLSVMMISLLTSAPWGADMAWIIILVGMAAGLADRVAYRPAMHPH